MGEGTFTFPDGSTYVGAWQDGQYHGQGKLTLKTGYTYTGYWETGQKHGWGEEIIVRYGDTAHYRGDFRQDKRHGHGIRIWKNWTYVGQWQHGKRHGLGATKFLNGFIYTGTYWENQRYGQGTLTYSDGSIFSGKFREGWPWAGEHRRDGAIIGTYFTENYTKAEN